eukprot:SM000110S18927  [mRNA]  locus=s110:368682:371490:- [translate_table: standard]
MLARRPRIRQPSSSPQCAAPWEALGHRKASGATLALKAMDPAAVPEDVEKSGGGGGGRGRWAPLPPLAQAGPASRPPAFGDEPADDNGGRPPAEFCCPITGHLMLDPVTVSSAGNTYERACIQELLDAGAPVCPTTGEPLQASEVLIPNRALRRLIAAWCDGHPGALTSPVMMCVPPIKSPGIPPGTPSPAPRPPSSGARAGPCFPVSVDAGAIEVSISRQRSLPGRLATEGESRPQEETLLRAPSYQEKRRPQFNGYGGGHRGGSLPSQNADSEANAEHDGDGGDELLEEVALDLGDESRELESGSRGGVSSADDSSSSSMAQKGVQPPAPVLRMDRWEPGLPPYAESPVPQSIGQLLGIDRPAGAEARRSRNDSRVSVSSSRDSRSGGQGAMEHAHSSSFSISHMPDPADVGEPADEIHIELVVTTLQTGTAAEMRGAAEELRVLARDNSANRANIGAAGAIPLLVVTLASASGLLLEHAVTALLNLCIRNERNAAEMAGLGVLDQLVALLNDSDTGGCCGREAAENAVALLRTLLLLSDDLKAEAVAKGAADVLVRTLISGSPVGKKDAVTALYYLASLPLERPAVVAAGAVQPLVALMQSPALGMVGRAVAVLSCLASLPAAQEQIADAPGGIAALVEVVEAGSPRERENAAATLLHLAVHSREHRASIWHAGAVPPLVALSQEGRPRAKEKAKALILLFRESRQHSAPS